MDIVEPYNTIMLTFVSSIAPDSNPIVTITTPSSSVSSITAASSDSTNYYALYTNTGEQGVHAAKWTAQKTTAGSTYNFIKSMLFNVKPTQ